MSTSFWKLCDQLQAGTFVDLTHPFDSQIPHFEQSVPLKIETVRTVEKEGYLVQRFHFEGQWGTHVDAPCHFITGLRTLDQISVREMILPLVVIDIHSQVSTQSDYAVEVKDIADCENRYGTIPQGAFVALRSDWSHRWPSQVKMHNRDAEGKSHTPGWSLECLKYLSEKRNITAIGHETIDPDPGISGAATGYACERYILSQNKYQIELLTHLDQCPEYGALIVCTFPKAKEASGFPARAFAICPP